MIINKQWHIITVHCMDRLLTLVMSVLVESITASECHNK